jgi:hypothetical protein
MKKQRQESDTIVPYYSFYPKALFFFFFDFTIDSNYSYELKSLLTYRSVFSVIVKQSEKDTQSVAVMLHKYLPQLL